ncbi:MAG: dihydroorotase [Eubacteriales bacterium]|nr:dihydroorotase [Eubacteriales bacterium]
MKIKISGGMVVNPITMTEEQRDVLIENGMFVDDLSGQPEQIIDATGLTVMPGLIDPHTHLRDPGFEYREDIVSGTKAAVRGGITAVACMPNTKPVIDNPTIVRYIKDKAAAEGFCKVLPVGAVSKNQDGKELAEIGLMAEQGIVAISDDGKPVLTADLMKKAIQYAAQFNLVVISHCEETTLADGGHMNEGIVSLEMGLKGIPTIAEDIMAARDILIAEYLGLPVHLAHLSTAGSIELVRQAKARGVQVTCETCPHYFTLTEEACRDFNTNAKMNPPLRTQMDVDAIICGLKDGTIDMIGTDHAPHHADEKQIEFGLANNGIIGFESSFALGYTYLVLPGHLTLPQLVAKMSTRPAELFHQKMGRIEAGYPADLVLVDLKKPFSFDKHASASKARNTPFHGWMLHGLIKKTFCDGKVVFE